MEMQSQQKTYENFVRNLIESFEKNPALWKEDDPSYKSRENREKAMNSFLEMAREFFPDANIDFVKTILDNITGGFKREYKKVTESKKKAKNDSEIYIPAPRYYNHLPFQYESEEIEEFKDNSRSPCICLDKTETVILIDLLRKYPILYTNYCTTKGNKSKSVKAYNDLTNELDAEIGSSFAITEIKLKMNTLKQQFRRDLMLFLKDSSGYNMSINKKGENVQNSSESEDGDTEETMWLDCEENDENVCKQEDKNCLEKDQDDIFDIIGKNVAIKLRDMSDDQRIHAERLINAVMYHGLMGHLTSDTEISLS